MVLLKLHDLRHTSATLLIFTFHYGSSQTYYYTDCSWTLFAIYIPLWFFSNPCPTKPSFPHLPTLISVDLHFPFNFLNIIPLPYLLNSPLTPCYSYDCRPPSIFTLLEVDRTNLPFCLKEI